MGREDEPDLWVRRLSAAMWAVAGAASVVQVYLNHQEFLLARCFVSWIVAFALWGVAFWLSGRHALWSRSPLAWTALLVVQAGCAVFMVRWYTSVFGTVLLVFGAWQVAQVWPLRRSLGWSGLQTLALGVAVVPLSPHLLWLMVTIVAGGLQLFATLAAHLLHVQAESRLALARANEELQAVQELLARSSRAAERLRVARELHDGMGHRLTALSLTLEATSHQSALEGEASLRRARDLVRDLLRELREVVSRMRDESPLDVAAALTDVVADIERPRIHLTVAAKAGDLDAARAHAVVRCVQEFVTNVIKHADARNLWVSLESSPSGVRLTVRDDGRGVGELREGSGLRGLRERVGLLGGRLDLALDGGGFGATVWFPAPETRA